MEKVYKNPKDQDEIKKLAEESLKKAEKKIVHAIKSNVVKTATKTIKCDASTWLKIKLTDKIFNQMTEEEQKAVIHAKRNDFMIVKHDQYIRQFGTYNGKTYVSKFIQRINDICHKYKLYQF